MSFVFPVDRLNEDMSITKTAAQNESDLVKLLKHMKNSLDIQIASKLDNPISLGLLVEGKF